VDRSDFETLIREEAFAEWAEVHGNFYGTSYRSLEAELSKGRDVILDIDVQGALQIADKVAGAVLVFVVPPSWDELRRRLEGRGLDEPEVIERRIGNARGEVAAASRYRYLVLNDDVDRAIVELAAIVRAERCRIERRAELIERLSKF
jgi:guanylate kinase